MKLKMNKMANLSTTMCNQYKIESKICSLFQILSMLQPGSSGPGVARDQQQETQNRLESGLRPVFKIENLQPGTQFRAVVFAKVRNYNQHHQHF